MEDLERMEENADVVSQDEAEDTISVQEIPEEEVLPSSNITETTEDVPDYKAEMRRLKQAYKAQRKAEKRKLQEEEASCCKPHTFRNILFSVLATLLILAILLGILAYFPSQKQSLLAHIVRKYTAAVQNPYPTQNDVTIGGQTVQPGDDVTIQVDGTYSATAIYAKAAKSVVGIEIRQVYSETPWEGYTEEAIVSQGSGVVYSEDGMILTNYHLLSYAIDTSTRSLNSNFKVIVHFNTDLTEYYIASSVIGYDVERDLALIKVDAKGLTPIELADTDTLEIGEPIAAIGSAAGLEYMNSLSDGIISGLDRKITSSSSNITMYEMIQITAPVSPGNSGGAILNREGKLIGICVIKIVSDSYECISFAVNANLIKRVVKSFLQYGRYVYPVMGVEVNSLYDVYAADQAGMPVGVYIAAIAEGSGAADAGIQVNDILCEIDGVRIKSIADLRKYLHRYDPEDTISVKIFRTNTQEYMDVTVKLNASE